MKPDFFRRVIGTFWPFNEGHNGLLRPQIFRKKKLTRSQETSPCSSSLPHIQPSPLSPISTIFLVGAPATSPPCPCPSLSLAKSLSLLLKSLSSPSLSRSLSWQPTPLMQVNSGRPAPFSSNLPHPSLTSARASLSLSRSISSPL